MRAVLRALRAALLVAALVTAPTPWAVADVARTDAFRDGVEQSIRNGADWLVETVREGKARTRAAESHPTGLWALIYTSLRAARVPRDNETAVFTLERLREEYLAARGEKRLRTYCVAATLLALERERSTLDPETEGDRKAARERAAWGRECVALLSARQLSDGSWSHGDRGVVAAGARRRGGDPGNTHSALLGLAAASRAGLRVPRSSFRRGLEFLLEAQQADGPEMVRPGVCVGPPERARGWGSVPGRTVEGKGPSAFGSMTAACVAAVLRCREELAGTAGYGADLDRRAERAACDGIAWLERHWSEAGNPAVDPCSPFPLVEGAEPVGGPRFRWAFHCASLERVGVLSGLDWIGDHDWYGEGVERLLKAQEGDGAWGRDVLDTCFALSFLSRGTTTIRRETEGPAGGAGQDVDFTLAEALEDQDFEDFIELVLTHWRRSSQPARRRELARNLAGVGRRVVPALLVRLDSSELEVRQPAHALLRAVTGKAFAYDAASDRSQREEALLAWHAWWIENGDALEPDQETGRLR